MSRCIVQQVVQTGPSMYRFFIGVAAAPQSPYSQVVFGSDSYRSQQLAIASARRYVEEHSKDLVGEQQAAGEAE